MKTILCYGDSNTFGYNPADGSRFPWRQRWPGRLSEMLGPQFRIIEEGLNHRTTVLDDPFNEGRSGLSYLRPCLESHRPIDLVILMLGSNDMKAHYGVDPELIARGIERLLEQIGICTWQPYGSAPRVLILPPPLPGRLSAFTDLFAGMELKASRLPELYRQVSVAHGCWFLNTQEFLRCPDTDGIHLDEQGHRLLAEGVYAFLQTQGF